MAKRRKIKIPIEVVNTVKKISPKSLIAYLLCFIIGLGSGVFVYTQICKNDKFEVLGDKSITLEVGQTYTFVDEGVCIISLGRDISNQVQIKTNFEKDETGHYIVDTSEDYEYYIIYTVQDIKYGNIQKIRTITIGEGL